MNQGIQLAQDARIAVWITIAFVGAALLASGVGRLLDWRDRRAEQDIDRFRRAGW